MSLRPALVLTAAALALAGCGSSGGSTGSTGSSGKVAVKAGDSTCEVAKTAFDKGGKITFDVENVGKDVTEVYVYGKGSSGKFDKVVGEVENVAPGTGRDFEVDVTGGEYQVACKPGQKGEGIRTEITVAGAAGKAEAEYDREVEVTARDYSLVGLSGFTGKVGEKIELKLKNTSSDNQHELEVFGPDGKKVGEVGPTQPGEEGEVVIELATAGTYTYMCGIDGHAGKGMKGTFTVT